MAKPKKTIRSFSLYFTDKDEMQKAIDLANSNNWCAGYDIIYDEIANGEYAILELWWDDITIETLDNFLTELSK